SLPVSFSFAIAPGVFVCLHILALVRYDMLAANLRQFTRELDATVPREQDRERCRLLLTHTEFIEAQIAPPGSALHSRLWPVLFVVIVAAIPLLVLLFVQINAIRYQSEFITNVQRAWLALDLLAVVLFFYRNAPDGSPWPGDLRTRLRRWVLLLGLPALIASFNALFLNVVPPDADSRIVRYEPGSAANAGIPLMALALQPLDWLACPHLNWGCRFLRVERRTLVEKVWDEKVMVSLLADGSEAKHSLSGVEGVVLRERSFRFADLTESRLYGADMTDVDLRQANLDRSSLQGARLAQAHMQGASLAQAQMQGSYLLRAEMQGANLVSAQLQGADLSDAQLQGADLSDAQLQGARLSDAQLHGASLLHADLAGADLAGAQMQGADLSDAQLQGANLRKAGLWHSRAPSGKPADIGLADVRDTDLTTPLSDEQRTLLRARLHAIPDAIRRRDVFERIQPVPLQESTLPAPAFRAAHGQPALSTAAPGTLFPGHPLSWQLAPPPPPAYISALARLLVDELAAKDPAVATGIARRAWRFIDDPDDQAVGTAIACRLLVHSVRFEPAGMADDLREAMADRKIACPRLATQPAR
ncbi:MAG: pentapeptide repeat-containing protein, partial [Proteobacteria bacterium]|nr:pentapeptide repeat-containing protein [Pseudomonadota bacterium]